MSRYSSTVLPYAEAVFPLAQESGEFDSWSACLTRLAEMAGNVQVNTEAPEEMLGELAGRL